MRECKMPSGATLQVHAAPFDDSKALFQAVMREVRKIKMEGNFNSLLKNLFCAGFSSPSVDAAMAVCMARCTYDYGKGHMKIDHDSFQPHERRQDYVPVCSEVLRENVGPFVNALSVKFAEGMAMLLGILKSSSEVTKTTTSSSSSG